jgi:hypothetical protein
LSLSLRERERQRPVRCPLCREPAEEAPACVSCGTRVHDECRDELTDLACPTLGCEEAMPTPEATPVPWVGRSREALDGGVGLQIFHPETAINPEEEERREAARVSGALQVMLAMIAFTLAIALPLNGESPAVGGLFAAVGLAFVVRAVRRS